MRVLTAVQFITQMRMAEEGTYRCVPAPVKVVRGRGCNESFRAAVDRSYETSQLITSPGKISRKLGVTGLFFSFTRVFQITYRFFPYSHAAIEDGGCNFPPRQLSLNSQFDCKLLKQPSAQKKKSSLLKGLGSMFR